jgi:hypothetical protein
VKKAPVRRTYRTDAVVDETYGTDWPAGEAEARLRAYLDAALRLHVRDVVTT